MTDDAWEDENNQICEELQINYLEPPLSITVVDCHIWNCLWLHRIPAEVLLPLNKM